MTATIATRFAPGATIAGIDPEITEVVKEITFTSSETYPAGGYSISVAADLSSILDCSCKFAPVASVCNADLVARYIGKSADSTHVFIRLFRAGSSGAAELATGTALTNDTSIIARITGARL